ncbi:hypothetical protein [Lysobacter zhanggongensis]|uniref:hypothetical protein n=1 Tax=Lysobacter zhanggongensis TaxID=1774951 RepID=UPI00399CA847
MKPEFWSSEQVMELTIAARLTFIGLWNFCDDRGVYTASPKRLKAQLFPSDNITSEGVAALVAELVHHGLVGEFEASGQRYWHVTGWAKHQLIRKPTYRYPIPPGWVAPDQSCPNWSGTHAELVPDQCGTDAELVPDEYTPEGKGMEGKGEEGNKSPRKRAARPQKTKIPEGFAVSAKVRQWASDKGYQNLDAHFESFVSKVAANGYLYADWDAALQNAIRDDWGKLRQPGRGTDAAPMRQRVDL